MKLALYANEKDGVARTVEIDTKAAHGKIEISNLEFPTFETLDEVINVAQSPEDKTPNATLLEFINDAVRAKKLSKVRAQMLAIPKSADLEVALDQIREQAKDVSTIFTSGERVSKVNKEKAAGYDKLQNAVAKAKEEGRELTMDEIMSLMTLAEG